MDKMAEELNEETLLVTALKAYHGQATTASGNNSQGQVNRTTGSPEWCGEFPWNFRKAVPCSGIPVADFEANNTFPDQMNDGLLVLGCFGNVFVKCESILYGICPLGDSHQNSMCYPIKPMSGSGLMLLPPWRRRPPSRLLSAPCRTFG